MSSDCETYISPPTQSFLMEKDHVMARFLRITGIKYALSIPDESKDVTSTILSSSYGLKWTGGNWQIWEDRNALPHVFVTGDYTVASTSADILSDMFSDGVKSRHITLEEPIDLKINPDVIGSAIIVHQTANTLTIETQTNQQALVYVAIRFHPHFKRLLTVHLQNFIGQIMHSGQLLFLQEFIRLQWNIIQDHGVRGPLYREFRGLYLELEVFSS